MLNGMKIIRIGMIIFTVSLIINHSINFSHELTSFFMGMGCSLSLAGAGKRLFEMRKV